MNESLFATTGAAVGVAVLSENANHASLESEDGAAPPEAKGSSVPAIVAAKGSLAPEVDEAKGSLTDVDEEANGSCDTPLVAEPDDDAKGSSTPPAEAKGSLVGALLITELLDGDAKGSSTEVLDFGDVFEANRSPAEVAPPPLLDPNGSLEANGSLAANGSTDDVGLSCFVSLVNMLLVLPNGSLASD